MYFIWNKKYVKKVIEKNIYMQKITNENIKNIERYEKLIRNKEKV